MTDKITILKDIEAYKKEMRSTTDIRKKLSLIKNIEAMQRVVNKLAY
ncbi:MAG: hypothetical protein ACTSWD_02480 [Candidatus Heimdallarchaeota archaeon]